MNYRPLGARILARPVEYDEVTPAGIILPEHAKERPGYADVLAIGPDVQHLRVGDRVTFLRYAAREFAIDNEQGDRVKVLSITEKDIDLVGREE